MSREVLLGVVRATGGSAAAAMRRIEDVERSKFDAAERIRVAEIAPKATARLVLWLPLVALVGSQLNGINVLGALAIPLGQASLVSGLVLLLVAWRWMRRLISRAVEQLDSCDEALMFDLLAVALGSGESLVRARSIALEAAEAAGIVLTSSHRVQFDEMVKHGRETGEPLVEALAAAAQEIRADGLRARLAAIERLGVRLTLPLGVAALPAFALMTVLPAALGSLSAAG